MPACQARPILRGQTAVVTGAASGIGRSIAVALCAAGANVVVNHLARPDDADLVVHEATHCGCAHRGQALALAADVSDEAQVIDMFRRAEDRFGAVDILINNAGLQQDAGFEHMSLAQWRRVIDVNLTGQFLCAREAVRAFKRRGVRPGVSCAAGKIVCVSSVHEVIPWAGHVNYAASKGGVMMLMKSIAQEVAPWRIRVNSICPGAVRTPINRPAWESPEAYAELLKLIPYKRIGEPDDVARLAVWLCSDEADYITGASLFVDGGMTLYPGFEAGG
ncbi:MAG: SDR family oxidoreductase [Phycisphaerae bacterium]|nr:SDR family oxidoreductase [Phycisphaerae bacterium]